MGISYVRAPVGEIPSVIGIFPTTDVFMCILEVA